jgi:hypothetical protein
MRVGKREKKEVSTTIIPGARTTFHNAKRQPVRVGVFP